MSTRRATLGSGASGFTLLEVVIALAVVSMVVLVLYSAFSTGLTAFGRSDAASARLERMGVVLRLLEDDLRRMRPYEFNGEEGQEAFISGGPRTLYYVTESGMGARERGSGGIYFACLWAQPSEEQGRRGEELYDLYLCKVNRPAPWFVQDLHKFRVASESERDDWQPSDEVREAGVLLLSGIEAPQFAYPETSDAQLPAQPEDWALTLTLGEDPYVGKHESKTKPLDQWSSPDLPSGVVLDFAGSAASADPDVKPRGWRAAAVPTALVPENAVATGGGGIGSEAEQEGQQ